MRIKVSPVEALARIDNLISDGAKLLDFISGDFWEQEEKADEAKKRAEKKKERDLEEKMKTADPMQRMALQMQTQMQILPMLSPFGPSTPVSEKVTKGYEDKHREWFNKADKTLKEIYKDFTPTYSFSHAKIDIDPKSSGVFRDFLETRAYLGAEIGILVDFYNDLKGLSKSHLNYLSDKTQIWFYDFAVQLSPETNESEMCRFMFQFGVGEWKEFAETYSFMTGEKTEYQDKWPKNWKDKVIHALESVNEKTNERFGFPVFKKEKTVLALNVPSRFM